MTKGYKGKVPDAYLYIRAAKYLNCKPWDLYERDDGEWWARQALIIEGTWEQAQSDLSKRGKR